MTEKKTLTVLSHFHATTIHNAFIVQSDPPQMDIIQSDTDCEQDFIGMMYNM